MRIKLLAGQAQNGFKGAPPPWPFIQGRPEIPAPLTAAWQERALVQDRVKMGQGGASSAQCRPLHMIPPGFCAQTVRGFAARVHLCR